MTNGRTNRGTVSAEENLWASLFLSQRPLSDIPQYATLVGQPCAGIYLKENTMRTFIFGMLGNALVAILIIKEP